MSVFETRDTKIGQGGMGPQIKVDILSMYYFSNLGTSVADLDPKDPYIFGPSGSASGSVSHKYGPASDPSIIKQKN